MQIIDQETYSACVDCYMLIANGDAPDGDTGELNAAIEAHAPHVVSDDDCDVYGAVRGSIRRELHAGDGDSEFSWQSCETCGSALGGSRHPVIALLVRS